MNRKLLLTTLMVLAASGTPAAEERGNLVLDNIPAVDTPLTARLENYLNSRGASFVDWLPGDGLLISTRFGDTDQIHRVMMPMGNREQLTFAAEPVTVARAPQSAVAPGFVFLRDQGGNENSQVHYFDLNSRAIRPLTSGAGLNGGLVWSHDGRRVAFHGTARDGVSYDLYIAEPANNAPPRLVYNGFQKHWSVHDWSPDDTRLLIENFVSVNESHLYVLDIATAALTPVSEGEDRASVNKARFTADGRGIYVITNRGSEFEQLRRVDLVTGEIEVLTAHIPWDIQDFARTNDGRYLAWVANADGVSRLTVVDVARRAEQLPPLPDGRIGRIGFDPWANGWRGRSRVRRRRAMCSYMKSNAMRWSATRAVKPVPSTRCNSYRRSWCATPPSIGPMAATARSPPSSTNRRLRVLTRCSSTSTAVPKANRFPPSVPSRSSWCARWASR